MAITEWLKLTKEEREKILAEGVAKRIARTHARGVPTTHGDMYGVYQIYPDGKKVYIKLYSNSDKEETANSKDTHA